jgi:hypothetical protein
MLNRRDFIKMVGGLGVLVLTPIDKLVNRRPLSLTGVNPEKGELYAGFYLLPQDAPLPSFIDIPAVPILDHVADEGAFSSDQFKGSTYYYESIDALKADVQLPLFVPSAPSDWAPFHGSVTRFKGSGAVWEIRYGFWAKADQSPLVTFLARPVFSHPYPVWPVVDLVKITTANVWEKAPVINPEKVQFTPTPGILLPLDQGYTVQWIDHDILYTVFIENQSRRAFAENFISSLAKK